MAPPPTHSADRGIATIAAMFLALAAGGLAYGLLMTGLAERQGYDRSDHTVRALEVAERGLVASELELACGIDLDGDGFGTVSGTWTGGTYSVVSTPDAGFTDRFSLVVNATYKTASRRIEAGMRRIIGGTFIEGLFSRDNLRFDGVNRTDAYDSRLGTYASQATNTDANGPYALLGGHVGSNSGFIELQGSSVTVRGDAIPGPGRTVNESGNPTVTGDTTAREAERVLYNTPLADFQAASQVNANLTWTSVGGNVTYSPINSSLSVKAGATVTFGPGTYFFSSFSMSGNSTIKFTGETKIYVTGSLDWTGGTLVNETGIPANLMIYAHPYPVPTGYAPTSTNVKINGGSGAAFAMYGPEANLTLSGGSTIFGAAVAKSITINGNCYYHYDTALDGFGVTPNARMQRLYWVDQAPPKR